MAQSLNVIQYEHIPAVYVWILAFVSALLLLLSYPPWDLSYLAWVALVPLLLAIQGRRPVESLLPGWFTGLLFFMGYFYWLSYPEGVTGFDYLLLGIYMGLYVGLFALVTAWGLGRGISLALIAPLAWVALDYLRANAGFLGLPLAQLGHSQSQNLWVIQIADITGVYGVSFLIVMVNATLAELLRSRKLLVARYFVTLGCVVLVGAYGYYRLSETAESADIDVTVIQPNIPQDIKWDSARMREHLEKHASLSLAAASERPGSLIIWPESSVPGSILKHLGWHQLVAGVTRATGQHVLLGSSGGPKFGTRDIPGDKWLNSAFLVRPPGIITAQYNKIRLLPFSEYEPASSWIPWPARYAHAGNKYLPGTEYSVFEVDGKPFSVLICWEAYFPALAREFVRHGAGFLVQMTNEAWFGDTAAPHQLLASTVFRAVENRVFVARSANTGVSGFINPLGRVVARVSVNGQDTFVEGYATHAVGMRRFETLYTRYGDVFAKTCLTCMGILIVGFLALRPGLRHIEQPNDT